MLLVKLRKKKISKILSINKYSILKIFIPKKSKLTNINKTIFILIIIFPAMKLKGNKAIKKLNEFVFI